MHYPRFCSANGMFQGTVAQMYNCYGFTQCIRTSENDIVNVAYDTYLPGTSSAAETLGWYFIYSLGLAGVTTTLQK